MTRCPYSLVWEYRCFLKRLTRERESEKEMKREKRKRRRGKKWCEPIYRCASKFHLKIKPRVFCVWKCLYSCCRDETTPGPPADLHDSPRMSDSNGNRTRAVHTAPINAYFITSEHPFYLRAPTLGSDSEKQPFVVQSRSRHKTWSSGQRGVM